MTQYGVWPPSALITALQRSFMFVQYFCISLSSILAHSSCIQAISSSFVFGKRFCTRTLSNRHTFSIGLRSGELAGHQSSRIALSWKYCFVAIALWDEALSCISRALFIPTRKISCSCLKLWMRVVILCVYDSDVKFPQSARSQINSGPFDPSPPIQA